MATQFSGQESKFDDMASELMTLGWMPPANVADRYRHLLRPFYAAKGFTSLPVDGHPLDRSDLENIAAIMAVFRTFDIDVPTAPAE